MAGHVGLKFHIEAPIFGDRHPVSHSGLTAGPRRVHTLAEERHQRAECRARGVHSTSSVRVEPWPPGSSANSFFCLRVSAGSVNRRTMITVRITKERLIGRVKKTVGSPRDNRS